MRAFHFQLHPVRKLALSLSPYLGAALLLGLSLMAASPRQAEQLRLVSWTMITPGHVAQHPNLSRLTLPGGQANLRLVFETPAGAHPPLAAYLSGLFSATARWNGAPIGSKGTPAADPHLEQAGPIDAVLPIPSSLIRPGPNVLDLSLSSHRLSYPVGSVLHLVNGSAGVSIAPYSHDQRRPIAGYVTPVIMIGLLALALIHIVGRTAQDQRGPLLAVSGLLVLAVIEISRSLIDYAYDLHIWRLLLLLISSTAAAIGFVETALEQAEAKSRAQVRGALAFALIIVLVASDSFDQRCSWMLCAGAMAAAAITINGALRRKPECLELAAALTLIVLFAIFDAHNFLDRSLYAAVAPLVVLVVSRREADGQRIALQRMAIGAAARRRLVPFADISAVHGAGNYAEFELASGARIRDDRKLTELCASLPQNFRRVHRSHVVNLDRASSLLTLGGGRYAIQMIGGSKIPVARGRYQALRAIFNAGGLPMPLAAD